MSRYNNIPTLKTPNDNFRKKGLSYLKGVIYPEVPVDERDIYVETEFGDRLEKLAEQFYSDSSLYWIIAIANPDMISFDSIYLPLGTQLRIPWDPSLIEEQFNVINRNE